jgi:hypothetical protein
MAFAVRSEMRMKNSLVYSLEIPLIHSHRQSFTVTLDSQVVCSTLDIGCLVASRVPNFPLIVVTAAGRIFVLSGCYRSFITPFIVCDAKSRAEPSELVSCVGV